MCITLEGRPRLVARLLDQPCGQGVARSGWELSEGPAQRLDGDRPQPQRLVDGARTDSRQELDDAGGGADHPEPPMLPDEVFGDGAAGETEARIVTGSPPAGGSLNPFHLQGRPPSEHGRHGAGEDRIRIPGPQGSKARFKAHVRTVGPRQQPDEFSPRVGTRDSPSVGIIRMTHKHSVSRQPRHESVHAPTVGGMPPAFPRRPWAVDNCHCVQFPPPEPPEGAPRGLSKLLAEENARLIFWLGLRSLIPHG